MRRIRIWRDDRGSAAVLVAISAVVLFSAGALAIDFGMLYTARAEAQRAADAAALAGVSALTEMGAVAAESEARARAQEYAGRNNIRGRPITAEEATVRVITDSAKVSVVIRRDSVRLWFAGMVGVQSMPVSARAAARALPATQAFCVKPFGPPDIWHDANEDWNSNRIEDGLENWIFGNHGGDYYRASTGARGVIPPETGYGSPYRGPDLDYGRQIALREEITGIPGNRYYKWEMPADPSMPNDCRWQGGGGAAAYRSNICNCNRNTIRTNARYNLIAGNMSGPTAQGVADLIQQDPGASWDGVAGRVVGSAFTPWTTSPRVVKVGLFAPNATSAAGPGGVIFNKFAVVFIESQSNAAAPITGRFLYILKDIRLTE